MNPTNWRLMHARMWKTEPINNNRRTNNQKYKNFITHKTFRTVFTIKKTDF
jgi:hypothetical protein